MTAWFTACLYAIVNQCAERKENITCTLVPNDIQGLCETAKLDNA